MDCVKYMEEEKFLKKKSSEKFKILYEKVEDLESQETELETKLGCQDCCCLENEDWIEKIKFEQKKILERIEDLENYVYQLEEKLKNKNGGSNPSGNI